MLSSRWPFIGSRILEKKEAPPSPGYSPESPGLKYTYAHSLGIMKLSFAGSAILCIVLVVLTAGCTVPGPGPSVPEPARPAPLYTAGDVLSGNMTLAGYDTPDPDAGLYKVVVLEYQPGPDMYVYTFVRPLANGSYQYVLHEDWLAKLGRSRAEFEAYGLVRNGTMPRGQLWKTSS